MVSSLPVLTVGGVVWASVSEDVVLLARLDEGERQTVYSALASTAGALLGFTITALAILIALPSSETVQALRRYAGWRTLFELLIAAIVLLGVMLVLSLVALVADVGAQAREELAVVVLASEHDLRWRGSRGSGPLLQPRGYRAGSGVALTSSPPDPHSHAHGAFALAVWGSRTGASSLSVHTRCSEGGTQIRRLVGTCLPCARWSWVASSPYTAACGIRSSSSTRVPPALRPVMPPNTAEVMQQSPATRLNEGLSSTNPVRSIDPLAPTQDISVSAPRLREGRT